MNRIARRTLLKGCVALGLGIPQGGASAARPKEGDLLVKAKDSSMTPLTPNDLPIGGPPIFAWAMDPADKVVRESRLNQILLVRLDATQLTDETKAHAADGVVAYSGVCTHEGCDVDDWLREEQALHCGCHFSKFDPKDNGKVTDGPASRRLPALPLKIVDGKLVVAEPFTARVG